MDHMIQSDTFSADCKYMFWILQAKFDVVLSAYSLMELENQKKRLEVVLNLWNKCSGYLVLIEPGTNAGFQLINEARDLLLDITKKRDSGYVFAPVSNSNLTLFSIVSNSLCIRLIISVRTAMPARGIPFKTERHAILSHHIHH